jgi:ribose 5-phosphate isomerase B
MRIALGADHAGYELKDRIKTYLAEKGVTVTDEGTVNGDSVDYPDFARKVAQDVVAGKVDSGILVCGTGIGMAIAANKVHGIRAAAANTEFEAQMAREHNDANILTVGARVVGEGIAERIVDTWLSTQFAGGRHQKRVDKIMEIERTENSAR